MQPSVRLRLHAVAPEPPDGPLQPPGGPAHAGRLPETEWPLRLLIVEDSADFAARLRGNLETEGFVVDVAATVLRGREHLIDAPPAFVIIDTMEPSRDIDDFLRTLRAGGNDVPVIVLTALGAESAKLHAFWLGADDCITKPVNPLELVARIRVLVRRAHPAFAISRRQWLRCGDIEISPAARVVKRNGVPVELRPKEFDLLLALFRQHDRVVTRAELLRDVWGYHASTVSRTVDTHIAGLRLKLEDDPLRPRHLLTVRAAGVPPPPGARSGLSPSGIPMYGCQYIPAGCGPRRCCTGKCQESGVFSQNVDNGDALRAPLIPIVQLRGR